MQRILSILFCVSILISLWFAHDYVKGPIATLYEGILVLFGVAFLFWPNKKLSIFLILFVFPLWMLFSYFNSPYDSLCKAFFALILLLFRLCTAKESNCK